MAGSVSPLQNQFNYFRDVPKYSWIFPYPVLVYSLQFASKMDGTAENGVNFVQG